MKNRQGIGKLSTLGGSSDAMQELSSGNDSEILQMPICNYQRVLTEWTKDCLLMSGQWLCWQPREVCPQVSVSD